MQKCIPFHLSVAFLVARSVCAVNSLREGKLNSAIGTLGHGTSRMKNLGNLYRSHGEVGSSKILCIYIRVSKLENLKLNRTPALSVSRIAVREIF